MFYIADIPFGRQGLHQAPPMHRLSSGFAPSSPYAPFYRQNAVDATLGKKSRRWIVLKRTAIAGIFS